jgi:hypothetical protein
VLAVGVLFELGGSHVAQEALAADVAHDGHRLGVVRQLALAACGWAEGSMRSGLVLAAAGEPCVGEFGCTRRG